MGGLIYGIASYAVFFFAFLYAIAFTGNFAVAHSLDSAAPQISGAAFTIDIVLLGLFAVQHSIMARPWFKRRWTKIVPKPLERSTYVLIASVILLLLFWQWRPIGPELWNVDGSILGGLLWILFWAGWSVVLLSTFMIDHFDLFGLRQVYLEYRGRPHTMPPFNTKGFYRFIRHPIMAGFVVAFWAAPVMSLGHLLFAIATTVYILVAIQLEERDLARGIGAPYAEYRERVPMLIPRSLGR
ncbi:MAG TPA: hypothetical protein VMT58_06550 [Candidatus Binataceae bacterium]|nr:hypothetical protein [Candidatus Binataceae bacterium]